MRPVRTQARSWRWAGRSRFAALACPQAITKPDYSGAAGGE